MGFPQPVANDGVLLALYEAASGRSRTRWLFSLGAVEVK